MTGRTNREDCVFEIVPDGEWSSLVSHERSVDHVKTVKGESYCDTQGFDFVKGASSLILSADHVSKGLQQSRFFDRPYTRGGRLDRSPGR